jgi:hypothetical protein
MKEDLNSSETSVLTRATRRNIPEDAILHSPRRENLRSYISIILQCLSSYNRRFHEVSSAWTLVPTQFETPEIQKRKQTKERTDGSDWARNTVVWMVIMKCETGLHKLFVDSVRDWIYSPVLASTERGPSRAVVFTNHIQTCLDVKCVCAAGDAWICPEARSCGPGTYSSRDKWRGILSWRASQQNSASEIYRKRPSIRVTVPPHQSHNHPSSCSDFNVSLSLFSSSASSQSSSSTSHVSFHLLRVH